MIERKMLLKAVLKTDFYLIPQIPYEPFMGIQPYILCPEPELVLKYSILRENQSYCKTNREHYHYKIKFISHSSQGRWHAT